ncbi:ABC transporter substrate-binding protein, partial [Symbiobacterium thermophilum]|uniref:ABC transporter substrate-binding protein n=1 Tax=Symbiobacterium thermophilum TaxID=2734 RepID=UPI0035C6FDAB
MKRILAGFLVASLFALAACGGRSPASGSGAGAETVKIGWIGPLSGANKTYGESAKRGVELALEEAGYKVGDLTVELIAGDDRSDSTEAVNLATKMMTQDRVAAIIGPVTSGSAIAVSAIAETYKVPMITATATA